MKLKLVNKRTADAGELYLYLTGDSAVNVVGLTIGTSTKFSDFIAANPDMEISMDSIEGARLYVGYGDFPTDPVPNGTQYYGWIEFTKKASEGEVWINLSNVDITGLPLALAGTTTDSQAFTLGYKNSINDIITQLKTDALNAPADSNAAYIKCASGQYKVVGPNGEPDSYASYSDYINLLNTNSSPLVITSDTPKDGSPKVFTGSFMNSSEGTDVMISLTAEDGTTLEVLQSQFTSEICYRCDGGTLSYNGGPQVDQNQSPQNTDAKLYANSTFRNILIGINEGYFTKDGPNASAGFAGDVPFTNDEGSDYAKVLHETSNSYGFPYADSNLKVLITAAPADTITLTICKDDEAFGYDGTPPETANQPTSGDYQFGIGESSSDLGMITIGGWRYPANAEGGYGGFLPDLPNWTKMHFAGPDKYIWIKNGDVSADGCFNTGAPTYNKDNVLVWGASVEWVAGVPSPDKPTS
jgi:hypothetical protein